LVYERKQRELILRGGQAGTVGRPAGPRPWDGSPRLSQGLARNADQRRPGPLSAGPHRLAPAAAPPGPPTWYSVANPVKPGQVALTHDRNHPASGAARVPTFPEQIRIRREKLDKLREPRRGPRTRSGNPRTLDRRGVAGGVRGPGGGPTATGQRVGIAGRVVLSRTGGKLCFATLA